MSAVTALGCGGSSSKSDAGGDGSGAAGSSAGGSTGAAGTGGGSAGSAGTSGSAGSGVAGRGGAGGGAGSVGSAGTTGGGGSAGSGGAAGRGGGGGSAGSTGTGGSSGTAGGSGNCLNVLPCGGDLVGTWRFTADCLDLASLQPAAQQGFCAEASVTAASITRSGTATFAANGTYTVSQTAAAIVDYAIPFSCVSDSAASCVDFGTLVQQYAAPGETFTCSGSTTCSCTDGVVQNGSDNGTYQTSGTRLTTTSAIDSSTGTGPYCVQGSTLHLITLDPNASTGIGEDIVAQKQ